MKTLSKRIFKFLGIAFGGLVVFILTVNLIVYASSRAHIYQDVKEAKEAQTVIILGAGVSAKGELSPFFKDRVDKAIEFYKAKKAGKILVSGDNSTTWHNEVNPVRDYLLSKDIPDENIFLDHAGFDTYSTMYRARDIFKVSSVVIVSQSFHLPRAVFIARSLGLDASGLAADDRPASISHYMREVLANEKAAMNLIFHRQPKFLGEAIPIMEAR